MSEPDRGRSPAAPASAPRTGAGGESRTVGSILGEHPAPPNLFGEAFSAKEGNTATGVPHRALTGQDGKRETTVLGLRQLLVQHHASPEQLARAQAQRDAMARLGLGESYRRLSRFPVNPSTRKGNLAEVVLAEYVSSASSVTLPVYRLRYNPNVEQSMKGDDVLAFDLDATPVRLLVGEAKFRSAPSRAAVEDIVLGLFRSFKAGIPASLQFVADRLYERGEHDLGRRVYGCATLYALGELRLDYVGLLLSDTGAASTVDTHTPDSLRRLAMISVSVEDPASLVDDCFGGLE